MYAISLALTMVIFDLENRIAGKQRDNPSAVPGQ